jgi:hypothetical protein
LDQNTKGIFSAYYHIGYDNINLPSWYKGTINVGLKFKLLPFLRRKNIHYERFSIALGWDGPISFSIQKDFVPGFMNSMFRNRLLNSTSDNLFVALSYSPSKNDPLPFNWLGSDETNGTFVQLNAEATLPVTESKKSLSPVEKPEDFYSIRGHFSISGAVCNLWNSFNMGASFSYFQLNRYAAFSSIDDLSILGSKKHYLIAIEPAISREDFPIHYYISPQINFDVINGQKFFVLKSRLMFYDAFGVEFKYFESLSNRDVPWHYKDYVVISPIVRINF